jgi:hypothetical protein
MDCDHVYLYYIYFEGLLYSLPYLMFVGVPRYFKDVLTPFLESGALLCDYRAL